MAKVLASANKQEGSPDYLIFCPGCKCGHGIWTTNSHLNPTWSFNGDLENPTFHPSLLVRSSNANGPTVCHSFITAGKIQFLNDCTHSLAGQTVDLEDF